MKPLAGITVLVTRPAHQADELCRLVTDAGGQALRWPALSIEPPSDRAHAETVATGLEQFDLAVFVSPNAVEHAVTARGGPLPASLPVAAVGPATAEALRSAGAERVIAPTKGFDSEALLESAELADVAGKRIAILRGDTGRELLAETLRERGATVEVVEVYRAVPAKRPAARVAAKLKRAEVDAVLCTSGRGLSALVDASDGKTRAGLVGAQLVVASARMVQLAESLGFKDPLVAPAPGDRALVDTLTAWARDRMNEESHNDTAPPPTPLRRDPTTTTVAWAAAIIGTLALAGGIYLEKEREKLKDRISEVRFELRDAEQAIATRQSGQADDAARRIAELERRNQQLADGIEYLRSQSEGARTNWVRTEVEYLLRMAAQHVAVQRDPGGALAALRAAESRLRDFADPAYAPVIARLQQDIAALEAVPMPDVEGIVMTIGGIANAVEGFPVKQPRPADERPRPAREPGFAGVDWSGLWARIRDSFRSMITIRREGRPEQLLLAPREELMIDLNAQLKLEGARLAVLRRDENAFRAAVRDARGWIDRWYDADDAAVQAALDELASLERQPIDARLPDVSGALRLLRGADGRTGTR